MRPWPRVPILNKLYFILQGGSSFRTEAITREGDNVISAVRETMRQVLEQHRQAINSAKVGVGR